MARTIAELPKGNRITDFISLGVVAKTFPLTTIKSVYFSGPHQAWLRGGATTARRSGEAHCH